MRESSRIAEIAERFFFGLNAKIEMTPVMAVDDLQKALSGVQRTLRLSGGRGLGLAASPVSRTAAAGCGA
jgi:hypothetical protein